MSPPALYDRTEQKGRRFIRQHTPLWRLVVLIVPFVLAVVLETISWFAVKPERSVNEHQKIHRARTAHIWRLKPDVSAAEGCLKQSLEIGAHFHERSLRDQRRYCCVVPKPITSE